LWASCTAPDPLTVGLHELLAHRGDSASDPVHSAALAGVLTAER
jgi:hypothetical protein